MDRAQHRGGGQQRPQGGQGDGRSGRSCHGAQGAGPQPAGQGHGSPQGQGAQAGQEGAGAQEAGQDREQPRPGAGHAQALAHGQAHQGGRGLAAVGQQADGGPGGGGHHRPPGGGGQGGAVGVVGGEEHARDLVGQHEADEAGGQDGQGIAHAGHLVGQQREEALGAVGCGQEHARPGSGHGCHGPGGAGGQVAGAGAFATGGEGRRQPRVEDCGHRHRQDRVGQEVDGLGVLVDGDGAGGAVGAGQGQDHQDAELLGQEGPHPRRAQPQRPAGGGAPQSQRGPQAQAQAVDGPQQGQAQGRHPCGGPPAQHLQGRRSGLLAAGRPHGGIEAVGGHHRQGGQDRGQGGPGEGPVGLEHPGEDHAHAVQGDLEGEHAQELGHQGDLQPGLHPLGDGEEARDRLGQERQGQRQGDQHHQDDAQQPRGGPLGLLAPPSTHRTRQERDDGGRQGPADHHLVEDVGDLVGRGVGARDGARAHGGGLDRPAQQAQGARDQGQSGHASGRGHQAAATAGRAGALGRAGRHQG